MRDRTLSTNFSIANLYQERDNAFDAALSTIGKALVAGRISEAKFWTLDDRLHSQFYRKQTNVEIIMFIDECKKLVEEFTTI